MLPVKEDNLLLSAHYTDKPRRYLWCTRNDIYFLEDGVLKKNSYTRLPNSLLEEEKSAFKAELEAVGYKSKSQFEATLLDSLIGQSWDVLMNEAALRGVRNAHKKKPHVDEEQKRNDVFKRFSGQIIKLDRKSFRIFDTGFAVRILMKSGSVEEKKAFVNHNRDDILVWCKEELQESESIRNKIGDISRFAPSEIILLKTSEIEVIFQRP